MQQLSPSTASTEPHCFGACEPQLETQLTQGKIPHDGTKTWGSQTSEYFLKFIIPVS